MLTLDPLEIAVQETLKGIPKEAKEGGWLWEQGRWTREVKDRLCQLGKSPSFSFRVHASDCPGADYGEWLYDLCWYVTDEVGLVRLPLVVECEWSPEGAYGTDFPKLLQARAEHRLWLFQLKTPDAIRQAFDECRDAIHRFKGSQPGDRYLFAGVGWKPRNFLFDLYIHQ